MHSEFEQALKDARPMLEALRIKLYHATPECYDNDEEEMLGDALDDFIDCVYRSGIRGWGPEITNFMCWK